MHHHYRVKKIVGRMQYTHPENVDAAIADLASAAGLIRVLAGGTDLLVQLRAGIREPEVVVDIKGIKETRTIAREGDGFLVGSAVAGAEMTEHGDLKKTWPGLVESVDLIGSTQVQGRASMGGNLCNASPAADSVPARIAADMVCHVVGPKGKRDVKVEDVCTGPGKTSLAKDEFILNFSLPARPANSGDAYLRFIPRTEMDIAVAGVGVNLTLDKSGTCTAARVAIGAVAPTALLVKDAGAALVGSKVDDAAIEKMVAAVRAACRPIDDKRGTIEYRVRVAGVLAERATRIALDRAKED
jgi:CO/xanthine dehydrogenase FAD-binding subunit